MYYIDPVAATTRAPTGGTTDDDAFVDDRLERPVQVAPMYELDFKTECWAPINLESFDSLKRRVYCPNCMEPDVDPFDEQREVRPISPDKISHMKYGKPVSYEEDKEFSDFCNKECIMFIDPSDSKQVAVSRAEDLVNLFVFIAQMTCFCFCCYACYSLCFTGCFAAQKDRAHGRWGSQVVGSQSVPTSFAPPPVVAGVPIGAPVAGRVLATGIPSAAGDWIGPCGKQNAAGNKFCTGCGTPKPAQTAAAADGGWTGPCGTRNDASNKFCVGCGTPKPQQAADGSWSGPCGTRNAASARFCTGCGTPKPADGMSASQRTMPDGTPESGQ
jgi:hypothetical protein